MPLSRACSLSWYCQFTSSSLTFASGNASHACTCEFTILMRTWTHNCAESASARLEVPRSSFQFACGSVRRACQELDQVWMQVLAQFLDQVVPQLQTCQAASSLCAACLCGATDLHTRPLSRNVHPIPGCMTRLVTACCTGFCVARPILSRPVVLLGNSWIWNLC